MEIRLARDSDGRRHPGTTGRAGGRGGTGPRKNAPAPFHGGDWTAQGLHKRAHSPLVGPWGPSPTSPPSAAILWRGAGTAHSLRPFPLRETPSPLLHSQLLVRHDSTRGSFEKGFAEGMSHHPPARDRSRCRGTENRARTLPKRRASVTVLPASHATRGTAPLEWFWRCRPPWENRGGRHLHTGSMTGGGGWSGGFSVGERMVREGTAWLTT